MNVRDFQMNLENCNNIADWMPGSSPILTEDELKRVFVLAMPKRWPVSYSNAGRTAASDTKVGLVTYFARCEALAVNNANMSKQHQNKSARWHRQFGQNDYDNTMTSVANASAEIIVPVIALAPLLLHARRRRAPNRCLNSRILVLCIRT